MWKIALAFILFAGVSLFVIMKGGDSIDMSGEKHGTETTHSEPAHAPAAAPAAPAPAAAPATEAPAK